MEEVLRQALDKMVADLNSDIEELNKNPLVEKIRQKKRLINQFSMQYGGGLLFTDVETDEVAKSNRTNIIPGQFKGMSLAKAVKMYLTLRGKDNPPKFADIKDALKQGDFDQRKVSDIRTALLKNNQLCLLNGDYFGLVEWYNSGKKKSNKDQAAEEALFEEEEAANNSAEVEELAVQQ